MFRKIWGWEFCRGPTFWIPCSIILLDWISKFYFNLILENPIITEQNLIATWFNGIISVPVILFKIFQGEISRWDVHLSLGYAYGSPIDRVVALLFVFFIVFSLWFVHRSQKKSCCAYFYCFVAGAFLANIIEKAITGKVVNWIAVDLFQEVWTRTMDGVVIGEYKITKIVNLADILILVCLPILLVFCLREIVLKTLRKEG
jgi:lipoprotein signal peptidase